jgi:hypothetical protein
MELMDITQQLGKFLSTRSQHYLLKRTYRTTILRGIIMTIYVKLGQSANSNLLYVRHEIVWDALWIFTNFTTLMSPNRVEVSE